MDLDILELCLYLAPTRGVLNNSLSEHFHWLLLKEIKEGMRGIQRKTNDFTAHLSFVTCIVNVGSPFLQQLESKCHIRLHFQFLHHPQE